ncbi:hypothetical protein T11_7628 [Trichinella zimbabwensis]|uniref:Uncharacterized protein n=1 Tax=Trichinella zimbabwensis TaxID=268475 RepID=A0A0V1I194_9BILA|nr:hypothetical protein T11_7628 [Trichinella zimbabwensis]
MAQAAAAEASGSLSDGSWGRSLQLLNLPGQVVHLSGQSLHGLGHIVLRLFRNAGVQLSSLLKVLFHIDHLFGQPACFGEGRRFLQPNGTIYFTQRYSTGEPRHQVAFRHTGPASQLCHLLGVLLDGLAITLTQEVKALD